MSETQTAPNRHQQPEVRSWKSTPRNKLHWSPEPTEAVDDIVGEDEPPAPQESLSLVLSSINLDNALLANSEMKRCAESLSMAGVAILLDCNATMYVLFLALHLI